MKVAFGNIQDAEASAKAKQSLMANDCISVLIQLLECDSLGPELPGGENFDIWDKNGPEIRYKYQLMAEAALALRRMMEIGQNEKFFGRKRIQKAVSEGAIEALIPHLYCTGCAAQYACGALKLIASFEDYRQHIIDAGALKHLCIMLNSDAVAKKS